MSRPVVLPTRLESYATVVPSVSGFEAAATTIAAAPHALPVRTERITLQLVKLAGHCSQTTALPLEATSGFWVAPAPLLSCVGAPPARSAAKVTPDPVAKSMNATVELPIVAPMRVEQPAGATSVVVPVPTLKTMIESHPLAARVKTMLLPLTSESESVAPGTEGTAASIAVEKR
jgi:hypothetical protein